MNTEVSQFLDELNHPLRSEIQLLREIILSVASNLEENIKWNGPNYSYQGEDRITMKIQPPKKIQIVFHCGVQKKASPKEKIIMDSEILEWRGNDRAFATFNTEDEIRESEKELRRVIVAWIENTM